MKPHKSTAQRFFESFLRENNLLDSFKTGIESNEGSLSKPFSVQSAFGPHRFTWHKTSEGHDFWHQTRINWEKRYKASGIDGNAMITLP